ncbi:hypothetical protein FH972_018853 [Carpinus fangiana]|uniref:glucan endo-1,3-beta-D-glucosidase n=1 Tax=Carpinus fangiana TaxID=176857 RepID=A0A5N6RNH4_9ROSI|nr:hypothetical protein FH972_018853 [Carpinus fangiana]
MDEVQAFQLVNTRIKPYFPATRITGIAVGLDSNIQVSTPNSLEILEKSYPPSAGIFKSNAYSTMIHLLQFLWNTKAPFWINVYPFFAYKYNSNSISLDYVLLSSTTRIIDQETNLQYDNMLYAHVDAVMSAITRMGFGGIDVQVSETGWPSKWDLDEIGATLENLVTYNGNLSGPTSERNYGLYQPNGTMCYNVGLPALSSNPIGHTSFVIKAANMECQSMVY